MKRSRGRNRRQGNPANRNYESNGPDVKVRGHASTVYEKYIALARDALTAGDPVHAENYFQHAEHYFRIFSANQPVKNETNSDASSEASSETSAEQEISSDTAENVNGAAEDQEPLKLSQDDETSAQNSTQSKGRRRGHLRRRPKSDAPAEADLSADASIDADATPEIKAS